MKTFVSVFSISFFLLLVWQCNPLFEHRDEATVPVSTVKNNLESEKKIAAEHLRDLSDIIGRRIMVVDEKINEADKDVKTLLKELRIKLVREKKKVDKSITEIEQSTTQTWKEINRRSAKILTDAKIETQKIEERVEDLMD